MFFRFYSGTDPMLRNIANKLQRIFVITTGTVYSFSDWQNTSCSGRPVVREVSHVALSYCTLRIPTHLIQQKSPWL